LFCKIIFNFLTTSQHDTRVYEVRNAEGYGARWEIYPQVQQNSNDSEGSSSKSNTLETEYPQGIIFRGFLEPQMEDGHAKGWVH